MLVEEEEERVSSLFLFFWVLYMQIEMKTLVHHLYGEKGETSGAEFTTPGFLLFPFV